MIWLQADFVGLQHVKSNTMQEDEYLAGESR